MTEAELIEALAEAMHAPPKAQLLRCPLCKHPSSFTPDHIFPDHMRCSSCHQLMWANLAPQPAILNASELSDDRAGAHRFLAFARAHADEVCRLLGGMGPKTVGFAREWLANAPDEGWPGQDDLRDAFYGRGKG